MERFLTISLQNGADPLDPMACIVTGQVKLDDSALDLPLDQVMERYWRPAFMQLKCQQDYLTEKALERLAAPPIG